MANESTQVYKEYEDALNKQKVQFKKIGSDGAANYVDASLQTLLDNGYRIKLLSGAEWYSFAKDNDQVQGGKLYDVNWKQKTVTGAQKSSGSFQGLWAKEAGQIYEMSVDGTKIPNSDGADVFHPSSGKCYVRIDNVSITSGTGDAAVKSITYSVKETKLNNDFKDFDLSNIETLRNLVEAGFIVFEKPDNQGGYSEVNIATDTSLQEVSDETELKKAEAKYEADMRKINAKDKKFDTDLAAMETERNAIKTEMDTLKSVAKDNVDRTFKLFG